MEYAEESLALAAALNAKGFTHIKPEDVSEWLESQGIGDAEAVDQAAITILGYANYERFWTLARLCPALSYALGVGTERYCGGIDLASRVPEDV
jgi:hypothetical protein